MRINYNDNSLVINLVKFTSELILTTWLIETLRIMFWLTITIRGNKYLKQSYENMHVETGNTWAVIIITSGVFPWFNK